MSSTAALALARSLHAKITLAPAKRKVRWVNCHDEKFLYPDQIFSEVAKA